MFELRKMSVNLHLSKEKSGFWGPVWLVFVAWWWDNITEPRKLAKKLNLILNNRNPVTCDGFCRRKKMFFFQIQDSRSLLGGNKLPSGVPSCTPVSGDQQQNSGVVRCPGVSSDSSLLEELVQIVEGLSLYFSDCEGRHLIRQDCVVEIVIFFC